ncbi:unnamed protein product [Soboliphyme baturini]|uniref:KH domain-containing protein n=1 Tax=Soboliphyme baturini TaxID=241478 RepID=A0A183I9G3_9BILA|nr:unnamed protein product [Soboliphyme baturini]
MNGTCETVTAPDRATAQVTEPSTSVQLPNLTSMVKSSEPELTQLMVGKKVLSTLSMHFPLAEKLLDDRFTELQNRSNDCKAPSAFDYFLSQRVVHLQEKVVAPVREYPQINFAGRLFGPRGRRLRALESDLDCRITVLRGGGAAGQANRGTNAGHQSNATKAPAEDLAVLIEVVDAACEANAKLQRAVTRINEIFKAVPSRYRQLKSKQPVSVVVNAVSNDKKSVIVDSEGFQLVQCRRRRK